ncbi:hypothetical protein GGR51DRAFT_321904 [Nemania sp. FL0031]|nr:hypothetical protein GGR51DRAFT_321904 [Nemania sp. FL0031]
MPLESVSNLSSTAAMRALEDRSPPEKSLLSLLCFLHHDRIPENLLKLHWEKARLPDTLNGLDFRSCCQKLQDDQLIEFRDENENGRATESLISIEKALQDEIQAIFFGNKDQLSRAFNATTSLLSSAWPKVITAEVHFSSVDEASRWKECQKLIPHIERVVEKYVAADDEIQSLCATSDLASLLIEASWYRMQRGQLASAAGLLEVASLVINRAPDDMLALLSALHNTGSAIALERHRHEDGLNHCREFVKVQERLFAQTGIETTKLAAAYSELGMALVINEQSSDDVLKLFEKSEEIRKRLPGFERVNLFNVLHGKGYFYLLRGDFEKAHDTLFQALQDRKAKFEADDTRGGRAGAALFDLGNITYRSGIQITGEKRLEKLSASIDYYKRAEKVFKVVYGEDDMSIADVNVAIARHILTAGPADIELQEAKDLLEMAIENYTRNTDAEREKARALFYLSRVFKIANQPVHSSNALEEAAALQRTFITDCQVPPEELTIESFDSLIMILKR